MVTVHSVAYTVIPGSLTSNCTVLFAFQSVAFSNKSVRLVISPIFSGGLDSNRFLHSVPTALAVRNGTETLG